jgi:hypothetical protein
VLGFGIENFSRSVLVEFNKGRIHPHIEPNLREALRLGITPFLDLILTSPRCAADATLKDVTVYARRRVAGTDIEWDQPAKILPLDPQVRTAILAIEREFTAGLQHLESTVAHLPSRLRSLLWIACAVPVLARAGVDVPSGDEALEQLITRLPVDLAARDEARLRFTARQAGPAAVHA